MNRWTQGLVIILGSMAATAAVLAGAVAWGPHHCKLAFPMVIGCAMGSYESLGGGMFAATAALFAGWLAWSAVQVQISAEEKRAAADRVEIENVLQGDLDYMAEGLRDSNGLQSFEMSIISMFTTLYSRPWTSVTISGCSEPKQENISRAFGSAVTKLGHSATRLRCKLASVTNTMRRTTRARINGGSRWRNHKGSSWGFACG